MSRIASNPKILGGKPVIKGTRISVEFVLELMASGVSQQEIVNDYPQVTLEDIQSCLRYAAGFIKNDVIIDIEAA